MNISKHSNLGVQDKVLNNQISDMGQGRFSSLADEVKRRLKHGTPPTRHECREAMRDFLSKGNVVTVLEPSGLGR